MAKRNDLAEALAAICLRLEKLEAALAASATKTKKADQAKEPK